MQQDRNYKYAPTCTGRAYSDRRSVTVMNRYPSCNGETDNDAGIGMGCGGGSEPMVLAMAYVLSQPFEKLYSAGDALKNGTLFMGLDLPYGGRK